LYHFINIFQGIKLSQGFFFLNANSKIRHFNDLLTPYLFDYHHEAINGVK